MTGYEPGCVWLPFPAVLSRGELSLQHGLSLSPVYGNFWAEHPCKWREHVWVVLAETDTEPVNGFDCRREVRRCSRCGSQVHQSACTAPPKRGRL